VASQSRLAAPAADQFVLTQNTSDWINLQKCDVVLNVALPDT
jgi:hypothetical protein